MHPADLDRLGVEPGGLVTHRPRRRARTVGRPARPGVPAWRRLRHPRGRLGRAAPRHSPRCALAPAGAAVARARGRRRRTAATQKGGIMVPVVERRMIAPNLHVLTVLAPDVAEAAEPGMFVILRAADDGERIPLTIADWDAAAGTVTSVFSQVGATTSRLARLTCRRRHPVLRRPPRAPDGDRPTSGPSSSSAAATASAASTRRPGAHGRRQPRRRAARGAERLPPLLGRPAGRRHRAAHHRDAGRQPRVTRDT